MDDRKFSCQCNLYGSWRCQKCDIKLRRPKYYGACICNHSFDHLHIGYTLCADCFKSVRSFIKEKL